MVALSTARTAADTAADAAGTAAYSAAAAVQAVMDIAGSDQDSYDAAAAAADTAMAAAAAAREASDAAGRATTSADAEAQQALAEAAKTDAETALGHATSYVGMVTQAKADDDEADRIAAAEAAAAKLLADTKQEAADAAGAAAVASTAASAAVEAQRANADINTITAAAFARAEDAAADAASAHGDAAAANNAAQAAMTQEDADMYKDQAEAAQRAAELAQANAESFAGIVGNVQMMMADAAEEADMLDGAKTAAMTAATAARQAATDADAAATAAEAAAPGSSDARDARAAATDADTAAGLAEAANMRAQDATDSETAIMQQMEAEAQQREAAGQLLVAENNRDEAQDARAAALLVQEQRDLADAQADAQDLYDDTEDGVLFHYNAVVSKAGLADGRATAARASANRAMRARTDYTNADKQADAAEAASAEAQDSLGRAMTAKDDADTALQAAKDATTSEAAKAALSDLEDANDDLTEEHMGETGAGMDYMAAKAAAGKAAQYANTHVLGLFTAANSYDIVEPIMDDATTPDDESMTVAQRRNAEIDGANGIGAAMMAAAMATAGDQEGDADTISSTWAPNTPDIDSTENLDEFVEMFPTVLITIDGDQITSDTQGTDANDDGDTADDNDTAPNAKRIMGVSGFPIALDIIEAGDDQNARVLAFTNKKQGTAEVTVIAAISYDNAELPTDAVVDDLGTKSGNTYTGVELDHDGSDASPAIMGTLTCHMPADCSVLEVDDTITVTGYRFTGSQEGREASDADPMNDYLLFGLWLDDDATDGASFGTFAVGGADYAFDAGNVNTLEGKASYSGPAVGAHHKTGEGVSFFSANARLNADFGDETAPGTVEGMISGISVNGGPAMSTPIMLLSTEAGSTFNGRAIMGPQSTPGSDQHMFNGTYSGGFFGDTADDPDTTDVMEDDITHPLAAAGTFGVTRTDSMDTTDTDDDVTESFVGAFGADKD